MGIAGAGKSTFIKEVTGLEVVIGHGLESCTKRVTGIRVQYKGVNLTLLESPGFNDTYRSDTDVLFDISSYLSETMEGSSLRSLRMFRKLVGDDALTNVILATTHWSRVSEQEGIRHESDLRGTFQNDLIAHGSQMTRCNDKQSGLAILDSLISKSRVVLDIQRELVDEGKNLIDTAAGHALNEELIALQKK
ncbi:Fc.00g022360.m01.CDS01 [Cosmosporella sp. VM-42]